MTTTGGSAIQFIGINKSFARFHAVKDLNLEIREGEFFSLLGPSGCGKTTSLRMLAGFEEPDTGQILLRNQDVTDVPPNRRNVNMVFQNYELFPHMTVFGNVAYGLRLKRVREPELSQRVHDMLRVVRVEGLEGRGARQLSGGQQQRVALARALVNRPAVLLLDEPLSALDVKLRKQMQLELKAIQHRLGTTFIYVTHDQEEALLMSDRIGIMNHGRLLQVGSPREIYDSPADAFVADFVGSLNTLDLRVDSVSAGVAEMRVSDQERIRVRVENGATWANPGGSVRVAVRPERISVGALGALGVDGALGADGVDGALDADGADGAGDGSRLAATVTGADYVGPATTYRADTAVGPISCQQPNDARQRDLAVGERIAVSWPLDAAFALPGAKAE